MMIDYQVQFINFPNSKTKEAVTENADGSYTIFIETSLSLQAQQEAFKHAMEHILGNDFEKIDISRIEKQAHNVVSSAQLSFI